MLFSHDNITADKFFCFEGALQASADSVLCKPEFMSLFSEYCYKDTTLSIAEGSPLTLCIGSAPLPAPTKSGYAITVTETGVAVRAASERLLCLAFITLCDMISAGSGEKDFRIPVCSFAETPKTDRQMVHFCVFAETTLSELKRYLRLFACLKFTHIIVEFWGMLRYDCLKALCWPHGFTKEEVKPIIEEIKALGVEFIPMFNHWGHATGCKVRHGKHVVLDQDPSLYRHFSHNGWCWAIERPQTQALLRQIRNELCELFGEGEYFHIGCDEAYGFGYSNEECAALTEFLNTTAAELKQQGRRMIIWGDMLLAPDPGHHPDNVYKDNNNPDPVCAAKLRESLDKDIILADWQYFVTHAPVESAALLQESGFDTILCSWDRSTENIRACAAAAAMQNLFGYMHTTWDSLQMWSVRIARAARAVWCDNEATRKSPDIRCETATLFRKMSDEHSYPTSGWSKHDTPNF